jgi:hypothetical protein
MSDKDTWSGLMKILEIQHRRGDEILWEASNIRNMLHNDGEQFMLRAAFTGGQNSSVIPLNYYLGLDNRPVLNPTDTLSNLQSEPSSNGYSRQGVHSSGDFTANFNLVTSHWQAISPVVSFQAFGGSWGPVQTLFLATTVDNSGLLISSAKLPTTVTVNAGDAITMRIAVMLKDCV